MNTGMNLDIYNITQVLPLLEPGSDFSNDSSIIRTGMCILLSPDHHIIEFPSSILPDDIKPGHIVNISVERNLDEEARQLEDFNLLQKQMFEVPHEPVISIKATTQTSIVIHWEPLVLFAATFLGIDVYRNGQKLSISPCENSKACKITSLDIEHEYEIYIVLRTTAGALISNKLNAKTHSLQNLSGIYPAFGQFSNEADIDLLVDLLGRVGAGFSDELSWENTHLVCTVAKGPKYEKAQELNIPVVTPEFLKACEAQGKMMPSHSFYTPPNKKL